MTPQPAPPGPSLASYLQVVRRRRALIVVVTLVTAALAVLPTLVADPMYSSVTQLRISTLTAEGIFEASDRSELAVDQFRELENELQVLQSAALRAEAQSRLPGPVPSYGGPIVRQIGASEIVELSVSARSPAVAADVANSFAQVYIEDRRNRAVDALVTKSEELRQQASEADAELDSLLTELSAGETAPAAAAGLQIRADSLTAQIQDFNRRADELDVETSLRGRGTQVLSPAELDLTPERPSPIRAAVLGLVLGGLLGLALAAMLDAAQDRLGSAEDLAALRPDIPVLATVPHTEFGAGLAAARPGVQEAYRYLRTSLRLYNIGSELRTIAVTSAVAEEGKTATAANLARTMAEAGDRVVLVDCDLRRPSIHHLFDLRADAGLTTVVRGVHELDEAIHFVGPNLAVVPAGPPLDDPTETLGSPRFAALLRGLQAEADVVILDTPPVLPVADALIAGRLVDGIVVVCRVDRVRRRSVRELLRRVGDSRLRLVGFVVNDAPHSVDYSYEGYRTEVG